MDGTNRADESIRAWNFVPISLFVSSGAWRVPELASPDKWPSYPGLKPLREASHANALDTIVGPTPASIGVHDKTTTSAAELKQMTDVEKCRHWACADGYDGIAVELTNARWRERWEHLCLRVDSDTLPRSSSRANLSAADAMDSRVQFEAEGWRAHPHFTRSELNILKPSEAPLVMAILSQWLELDSPDEGVRFDSEIALRQELAHAAYVGIEEVILPPPSSDPERQSYLADYARAVRSCLTSMAGQAPVTNASMKVAIRLPVSSPHILASMLVHQATKGPHGSAAMPAAAYLRTKDNWAWETWEKLQELCGYHPQLYVALDLSMPLPPTSSMMRWINEPVSHLWLPSSSFLANAKGYPVLSKSAQTLVQYLVPHGPHIVLSDITSPPPQHTRGGPMAYVQYVRHLMKVMKAPTKLEKLALKVGDCLQAPLEPMSDNLAGVTYGVFEADSVKYRLYEEAMFQAFSQLGTPTTRLRVWIVGAGHGALVSRCLAAAERASRWVHITALEKNPGAFINLQDRQLSEWGAEHVHVLLGDMRNISVPTNVSERADVVVSELLGSFGDNELAPECLDGAMRLLKPGGISIPGSYMPYIVPITAPKLHTTIKSGTMNRADAASLAGEGMGTAMNTAAKFDAPSVVLFKSMSFLSGLDSACQYPRVQPCWRFEHTSMDESGLACGRTGLPLTNSHNARSSMNTFYIPHAGVCHGLAGYFEAHLFGSVVLSIFPDPARASPDMLSWFPMFFPFRTPLYVPAHSQLDVHMWRLTDNHHVWYEWSAESYLCVDSPSLHASSASASPKPVSTPMVQQDESRQSESLPPFSNAPHTPMVPPSALMGTGVSQADTLESAANPGVDANSLVYSPLKRRIKTGQTDLMNAGACGFKLTISTS